MLALHNAYNEEDLLAFDDRVSERASGRVVSGPRILRGTAG